jgi:hypothetical protein
VLLFDHVTKTLKPFGNPSSYDPSLYINDILSGLRKYGNFFVSVLSVYTSNTFEPVDSKNNSLSVIDISVRSKYMLVQNYLMQMVFGVCKNLYPVLYLNFFGSLYLFLYKW